MGNRTFKLPLYGAIESMSAVPKAPPALNPLATLGCAWPAAPAAARTDNPKTMPSRLTRMTLSKRRSKRILGDLDDGDLQSGGIERQHQIATLEHGGRRRARAQRLQAVEDSLETAVDAAVPVARIAVAHPQR